MTAILEIFIIKTDSNEMKAMQEQGRLYAAMCKENKNHDRGPPHLFIFGGLLAALVERKETVGARTAEALVKHQTEWAELELGDRADQMRVCRSETCYKSEFKKLIICPGPFMDLKFRKAFKDALIQTGADYKMGRAPAGGLERDLQGWLTTFLEE